MFLFIIFFTMMNEARTGREGDSSWNLFSEWLNLLLYFPSPTCAEEGGNRWTQEEEGGECGTKEMGEEQMELGEREEESQQGWYESFPLDLVLKWRSVYTMGQLDFALGCIIISLCGTYT